MATHICTAVTTTAHGEPSGATNNHDTATVPGPITRSDIHIPALVSIAGGHFRVSPNAAGSITDINKSRPSTMRRRATCAHRNVPWRTNFRISG